MTTSSKDLIIETTVGILVVTWQQFKNICSKWINMRETHFSCDSKLGHLMCIFGVKINVFICILTYMAEQLQSAGLGWATLFQVAGWRMGENEAAVAETNILPAASQHTDHYWSPTDDSPQWGQCPVNITHNTWWPDNCIYAQGSRMPFVYNCINTIPYYCISKNRDLWAVSHWPNKLFPFMPREIWVFH